MEERMTNPLADAPKARAKLAAMGDVAESAHDILRGTTAKLSALHRQAALSSKEAATEIATEIARLTEVQDRHRANFLEADGVAQRCRTFLQMLPPGKIVTDAPSAHRVNVTGGGGFREAVARLREEIGTVTKDLRNAQVAPLPVAIKKQRLREHVEALAAANQPRFTLYQDAPVKVDFANSKDAFAVLAGIAPDLAIERLFALIDKMPESPLALAPDVRTKRIETLTNKLNELEFKEEALIARAADDEGQVIPRRLMASPAAVLGVIVKDRPPVAKKERSIADPAATAVA
jgi:hypothetical protein